ncbi:hypothetical protein Y032_0133g1745 [Ancylostoma ceylanicum]|nr:hypothetical protein Y032_0133g1745 [Ancylostoma ceylanicum]
MGIFCVVLLLYAPATAYKSRKETVETASDLFPYEFPEVVGLRALYPVTTGALKPTFATIYTPAGGDISFYIAPAEHCQAVYVCFSSSMIENNEGEIERFHVDEICQESLRFLTLEQTVYHTSNGETKAYVHFTALVELIQLENDGEMVYKYEAWSEMTTEDVAELERTVTIRFDLEGKKIVLLTSSPYCHVTLDQEYTKALVGHRIVFEPRKNVSNYLKFHGDNGVVHYTHYIVSGSAAGSTIRSGVRRSSSFFDPTRRFSEPYDCCTDPTEFEGFIGDAYWDPEYLRPKFNRYFLTTVRRNENVCRGDEILDGENILFQSFLVEIGDRCEWLALCFDVVTDEALCAQDANMLGLVLNHEVYIPTDSELHSDMICLCFILSPEWLIYEGVNEIRAERCSTIVDAAAAHVID